MTNTYIIILITVPSKEVGEEIAQKLLEDKLAACVNILPAIDSHYIWKGEICNDEELLLIVKSRFELFKTEIIPAVKSLHPYEVPEIIALPIIAGNLEYLDWIWEVTK
jgi:periplasmic divalent cation tolerance protein